MDESQPAVVSPQSPVRPLVRGEPSVSSPLESSAVAAGHAAIESTTSSSKNPVQIVGESASKKAAASLPGCAHYKRKCKLVCPDPKCNKAYVCRICHDEAESHQLDRYKVKEVVCLNCQQRQPVSNLCVNCSTVFGRYYCKICNLFMDVYKDVFHCEGCGLCRIGPKENFYHCEKCQMCMPVAMGEGKHRCIENSSKRDCPVCLDDIHSSRVSSHVPPCGHLLHQHCFNALINKAFYACPICNQSMIEMKAVWKYLDDQLAASPPLPRGFANQVQILCRDCHEFSTVTFHFIGLKCGGCGGYNTRIEAGSALNPEAFVTQQQQNEEVQIDLPEAVMGEGEDNDEDEDEDDGDDLDELTTDTDEYQSLDDVEDSIYGRGRWTDEEEEEEDAGAENPSSEDLQTPLETQPEATSMEVSTHPRTPENNPSTAINNNIEGTNDGGEHSRSSQR